MSPARRRRQRIRARMVRKGGVVFLIAASVLSYMAWSDRGSSVASSNGALACAAPGIIDGDTIRCGSVRVRLWGIDAPERDTPAGPPSTRALAQIINGGTIMCEQKDTDRYGRTVALCRLNGVDIAAEMVRQGQAKDYPRYSGGYYAAR